MYFFIPVGNENCSCSTAKHSLLEVFIAYSAEMFVRVQSDVPAPFTKFPSQANCSPLQGQPVRKEGGWIPQQLRAKWKNSKGL